MGVFERDGVRLAYEERGAGSGAPVLLLHGFTGDRRMWKPVAEALEKQHRLVIPDLRGHGDSDAPPEVDSYTMEGYAADALGLLDHLGIDRAHVVGSSFGGMVAMELAVTWPQRVETLVLSDTSPAYDRPEYDDRFRERERGMAEMVDAIARFGPLEAGRRAAQAAGDDYLARAIRQRYASMQADGIVGAARARRQRRDLTGMLARQLTMPILLCMGRDDPVYCALAVMVRELPGARQVIFEHAGHGVPARATNRFIETLQAFYHDVAAGKPVAAEVAL